MFFKNLIPNIYLFLLITVGKVPIRNLPLGSLHLGFR